jgi:hypothetical protein
LLAVVSWCSLPATAHASGAEFNSLLLRYLWVSSTATALLYAILSITMKNRSPWRATAALAQLGLALAGTAVAFVLDPVQGHPFVLLFVVLLLEPCVLFLHLRGSARFLMLFGWFLPPIVLWFPGLFVLGPAMPWLEQAGTALRR